MMKYTNKLNWALMLLLPISVSAMASAAVDKKMNVVFILADDLGWADAALYGHTSLYDTPNLKRLGAKGMTFTRAYANSPLCSPTRASILTGQNPTRHGSTEPIHHTKPEILEPSATETGPPDTKTGGVQSVSRLDTKLPTLGKRMLAAGYHTGHFGKWHLGQKPYTALDHGFEIQIPFNTGPGPVRSYVAPWRYPNLKPNAPKEHIEDRVAEEAVKWMQGLDASKPFFMNYWQFSVHGPWNAKKELIAQYQEQISQENAQSSATYAAMVHSLDDGVGTVLDAIEARGLEKETIIIFLSDNGGNIHTRLGETDSAGKKFRAAPTSNRPLRGGKASIWEGGIRVPGVVVWPGVTEPGSTSDAIIQASDFYTTLLTRLGIGMPENHAVDGIDITPALQATPISPPSGPTQWLFQEPPAKSNFLSALLIGERRLSEQAGFFRVHGDGLLDERVEFLPLA